LQSYEGAECRPIIEWNTEMVRWDGLRTRISQARSARPEAASTRALAKAPRALLVPPGTTFSSVALETWLGAYTDGSRGGSEGTPSPRDQKKERDKREKGKGR